MHIKSVAYTFTFNIGSYQSEKIGVEVELNAGESANDALETARNLVNEFHEKNFPKQDIPDYESFPIEPPPIVIQKQEKRSLFEETKYQIDQCKTEEELNAWALMVKNKPELQDYYNAKLLTFK